MNRTAKQEIILVLVGITLLIFLASCSSATTTNNIPVDSVVVLRGKSLESNTVAALGTTKKYNVFKIGDTVYVDINSMRVMNTIRAVIADPKRYKRYIIEEDNDAMRTPKEAELLNEVLSKVKKQ